jgi:hypothetical protein
MGCTLVRFTRQEICDLEELVHRSGEPVVVKGVRSKGSLTTHLTP